MEGNWRILVSFYFNDLVENQESRKLSTILGAMAASASKNPLKINIENYLKKNNKYI